MKRPASDIKLFTNLLGRLLLAPLGKFVLIPILSAFIGIIIVSRITDWWIGADSYYIYLVGDHRNNPAIAEIFEGFRDKPCDSGDILILDEGINNVPIKAKCVDDQDDPIKARQISDNLAARKDTLMVIGHVKSTQTKAALPAYLQQAMPPVPVILTMETNPQLIPVKKSDQESSDDYSPLFRLWPTDDEQAARAAQFAAGNKNSVLWVVEDEHNPVYSKYLALKFVEWVQKKNEQAMKVALWSSNMSVPSAETLKKLDIDFVFFAGDWSNALILINQIKRLLPNQKITLFLSDAAAGEELLDNGKDDLIQLNVHLTFPLKRKLYSETSDNGFKFIGKDARSIVNWLIDETRQHYATESRERASFKYWAMLLLNRHEIEDARSVLNARMEKAVRDDKVFEGKLNRYQFIRDNGKNILAQWHIWKVEKVKKDGQYQYRFVDAE